MRIVPDRGGEIVKQFRQYRWLPKEEGGSHGKHSKHIVMAMAVNGHMTLTEQLMVKGGTYYHVISLH